MSRTRSSMWSIRFNPFATMKRDDARRQTVSLKASVLERSDAGPASFAATEGTTAPSVRRGYPLGSSPSSTRLYAVLFEQSR